MAGESTTHEGCTYPRGFPQGYVWPWPLIPARDLVSLQYGRALTASDRAPGRVPVYGTNGQCGWHNKPLANGPGIILGRKGQGPLGVEWCDSDFWVIDTAYYISLLRSDLDLPFLYHLVKYVGLNHLKDGTSNPTLSRDSFGSQLLPLPPLPEQKRIAHILGTLDDKIELNRRMNATLEAMSRAIFKSWFVDFDPVRQKAAGKQPVGMDAETAALFPDSFEDSEIGEVPKGWGVGRLSDVAEHPRRAARPGEISVGTPYIGLEHMPRRCIALSEWGEGDVVESNKFEFQRGEILFGKLRPYFHKVGVAPVDGVCSTDIVVARPISPAWFGFVLGVMSSDEFVAYTNAGSTGTKMPRTNWDDMSRYEAVLPPESVAEAFTSVAQPAVASIAARIHQSRTLASLRDTLLPKLLSGELRVPEAEEAVSEAVR